MRTQAGSIGVVGMSLQLSADGYLRRKTAVLKAGRSSKMRAESLSLTVSVPSHSAMREEQQLVEIDALIGGRWHFR